MENIQKSYKNIFSLLCEHRISLIIRIFAEKFRQHGYKETVYEVIGAAMTVHTELGYGLQEGIYNESLCLELQDRHIDAESEVELLCYYKGRQLQKKYRMDIVVGDIIVELKSVSKILDEHRAQLFNYLRLTKKPVGLLVNFGVRGLMCERYAFDESCNECILLDKNMNPFY